MRLRRCPAAAAQAAQLRARGTAPHNRNQPEQTSPTRRTTAQLVATQHTTSQHSTTRRNTAHRVATQHTGLQRCNAQPPSGGADQNSGGAAAAVACAPSGRRGWCGPDAPAARARAPTRRAPSTPAVRRAAEVARRRAGGARTAVHAARRVAAHACATSATGARAACAQLTCTARSHMLRAARWFAHCSSTVRAVASGRTDLASSTDSANAPTPCTAHPCRPRPCPVCCRPSPAVLGRLLTHAPCVSATTAAERAQLASRRLDRICEALRGILRHSARPHGRAGYDRAVTLCGETETSLALSPLPADARTRRRRGRRGSAAACRCARAASSPLHSMHTRSAPTVPRSAAPCAPGAGAKRYGPTPGFSRIPSADAGLFTDSIGRRRAFHGFHRPTPGSGQAPSCAEWSRARIRASGGRAGGAPASSRAATERISSDRSSARIPSARKLRRHAHSASATKSSESCCRTRERARQHCSLDGSIARACARAKERD